MTEKGEGRSDVFAEIDGDVVTVHPHNETGFEITLDKMPAQVNLMLAMPFIPTNYFSLDFEEGYSIAGANGYRCYRVHRLPSSTANLFGQSQR